jgi:methylglutaconyl-CoA hydratase
VNPGTPSRSVLVSDAGGVRTLTLNRPEVRNAFDEELIAILTAAARDAWGPGLRAVVLRGAGSAFSAGADAAWMRRAAARGQKENEADAQRLASLFLALDSIPVPTLAVIHGPALGGGAGLAAVADLAIATREARIGFPEVRLGLVPAVVAAFVVPRIGRATARRLFATGEVLDGAQAAALGLVSECVAKEHLEARVEEHLRAILAAAPLATRRAKALVDLVAPAPEAQVLDALARLIADVRAGPEARRGLEAFIAGQAPDWTAEDRA